MEFQISDTFITSLTKLTAQEQKSVKTTAFDLQANPAGPGVLFTVPRICSAAFTKVMEYGKLRGFRTFRANIPKDNAAMLRIWRKHNARVLDQGDCYEVEIAQQTDPILVNHPTNSNNPIPRIPPKFIFRPLRSQGIIT